MPKGYHHLTRDQRCQLYILKARGDSVSIIANEIEAHRPTVKPHFLNHAEYAYIFGAVCPARDQGIGLVLPTVNSTAMIAHLQHISDQIPEGRHAVLVLDQAAWHMKSKVKQYGNLTLLPLPPASPELNPVEQVWQLLRDNWLANRC